MKIKTLFIAMSAMLLLSACDSGSSDTVDAGEAENVAEESGGSYAVDVASSEVHWTGEKLAYVHEGMIDISEGSLSVEDGKISGGSFVIDMNTLMENGTGTFQNEQKVQELVGHLKSEDFFDVSTYPTAKFEITEVVEGTISGNLTIKSTTKNISFPARISVSDGKVNADASFAINRADFDIRYGSTSFFDDLIDKNVISDDIKFSISLVATN